MGSKRKLPAQEPLAAAPIAKKQRKHETNTNSATPPPLDNSPFLDNPKGADLKREVALYEVLGSEDTAERLNAASAIVSGLLDGDGVEESTLQRHLERRLFRGLASGRKGSRLGFSVVLAEILAQLFGTEPLSATKYTGLNFDKVLGFLIAKTKPDGDLSGQEERDHFLGLLFGLQSFVRARILFGPDDSWSLILAKLLELAKKKPWIREECGWVIVEALAQMNQKQAEYTMNKLQEEGLAQSPEGVGIWLTARNLHPDMKFPNKPWGQSGNPLEHLKPLAKALKESSSNNESNSQQAKQTGNWNAQLHFAWNIVLAQYAQGVKNKTHGIKKDFESFWKVAVDESLFASTASRERKFWGFLLFQKVLQDSSSYSKLFPSIFSPNLVRCLINQMQEKDRFLNRAADKSLKILVQAVESDPSSLLSILQPLIGGQGIYNFDRMTKTKTVERILTKVDGLNAKKVVDALAAPATIVKGDDPVKNAETLRQVLGDYLLNMVKRIDPTEETSNSSWVGDILLPKLANVAYCKDSTFEPPVSERTRTLFRNRLMSAFAHLLTDLRGFSYPCNLIRSIEPDAVDMDEHITAAKDKALSTLSKISKKSNEVESEDKAPLQALALLYSLVLFQLYNGESEALSILEELKLCYDKLIRHKDNGDSNLEAVEVLVELLLSFISKPSVLLRRVTEHVFITFMSHMTENGLKLMTDVLESSESLRGQRELFDQEPEDAEGMDVDEDGEADSDVEVVDMNGDEGNFNGHLAEGLDDDDDDDDDDDASEDEDDGSSEEQDEEEAKKLDDALAKALGTHRLDQDLDAEESDSDADMTDSEMMALDSKLVEIFSQRKKQPNKKQEQKDAKETMVNFKSRILDLLDIYVKKQANNPLAFGLLLPLLQLIRTTKIKQLASKAQNIILSFAKAAKGMKKDFTVDISVSEQIALMKAIHAEASKDPSHILAKSASTSSLLVASSLYRADKKTVKKIATVYRDTQVAWFEGEVKMQAAFFVEWINWCQSHAGS